MSPLKISSVSGSGAVAETADRGQGARASAAPGAISEMSKLTPRMPIGDAVGPRRVTASDFRSWPSLDWH